MDWLNKRDKHQETYEAALSALTELVEQHLAGRRFLMVKKPQIDVEVWLRRQLRLREALEMDRELTATLLGTDNFVQIA